jgi:hypothetical protein
LLAKANGLGVHSLRRMAITGWVRAGGALAVAQELARHSTPKLTGRVCVTLHMKDYEKALAGNRASEEAGNAAQGASARRND